MYKDKSEELLLDQALEEFFDLAVKRAPVEWVEKLVRDKLSQVSTEIEKG